MEFSTGFRPEGLNYYGRIDVESHGHPVNVWECWHTNHKTAEEAEECARQELRQAVTVAARNLG